MGDRNVAKPYTPVTFHFSLRKVGEGAMGDRKTGGSKQGIVTRQYDRREKNKNKKDLKRDGKKFKWVPSTRQILSSDRWTKRETGERRNKAL